MKHVIASIGACLLLASAEAVFAGQPGPSAGVNCGTATGPNLPGNAGLSTGAPFNEPGSIVSTNPGGIAGMHYAGNTGNPTAKPGGVGSANAVSQYDIACARQPP